MAIPFKDFLEMDGINNESIEERLEDVKGKLYRYCSETGLNVFELEPDEIITIFNDCGLFIVDIESWGKGERGRVLRSRHNGDNGAH